MTVTLSERAAPDLTSRYRERYLPGFDCRLATARNALAAAGVPLAPPAALGLSGALCFAYAPAHANRFPFHSVAGISDQSVIGLAAATGAYLAAGTAPRGTAFTRSPVGRHLAAGVPVQVAVHRDTLRRAGRPDHPAHGDLGAHFVSLTAHDAARARVTVFETDRREPMEVTVAALEQAWYLDRDVVRPLADPTLPCDGSWFALLVPSVEPCWEVAAPWAVHRVVAGFESPAVPTMGAPAVDAFERELPYWVEESGADHEGLMRSIRMLGVMVRALSGGGLGRRLYGRFLREVGRRFRLPAAGEVAAAFDRCGEGWTAFVAAVEGAASEGAGNRQLLERTLAHQAPRLAAFERDQLSRLAGLSRALGAGGAA
ncbi:MAG: DUF4872 domain-containing protein [Gemmatimonadaceae bacterium]